MNKVNFMDNCLTADIMIFLITFLKTFKTQIAHANLLVSFNHLILLLHWLQDLEMRQKDQLHDIVQSVF